MKITRNLVVPISRFHTHVNKITLQLLMLLGFGGFFFFSFFFFFFFFLSFHVWVYPVKTLQMLSQTAEPDPFLDTDIRLIFVVLTDCGRSK